MTNATGLSVRRSIVVETSQARAFETFVNMTAWWPMDTHTMGEKPGRATIVEPHQGGRWYGIGADGKELDIGRVLVYEPNDRLVLTWEVSCNFEHDPATNTEVEALFIVESPTRTRVELEHRGLEKYGDRAEEMKTMYEGDDAWTYVWECYRKVASGETAA
jgi:uncharacterized protein YndB with AHSA1/START domain